MEWNIRKATSEDIGAIQHLNTKLRHKDYEEYDQTINVDFPLSDGGSAYFKERIESPDSFALVAESASTVVGYFVGTVIKPEMYRTMSEIGEGENMFVDDGFQGQGIGTQFMEKFEEWCKGRGVARTRVVASAENKVAIEFYKKVGFEKYDLTLEKDL